MTQNKIEIDDLDRTLLRELNSDAQRSNAALATACGTSQPTIWRRIERLRQARIIGSKTVEFDLPAIGFNVTVFLGVKLSARGMVGVEGFERAVCAIPEVQSVEHVLGVYDYRLRVVARNISDFERVLRRRIMGLPGLGTVEANILSSEELLPGPL